MLLLRAMVGSCSFNLERSDKWLAGGMGRADEKTGDTAVALLRAGADTDKKDVDGFLAMDLAPDSQVMCPTTCPPQVLTSVNFQVKKFIIQTAEREGIEL
jgi:26S proteasome non-ATPase regulatory subunit 10